MLEVSKTASLEGRGFSFSTSEALGAEKLNDRFDPVFSSDGLDSPKEKPCDAVVAAVLVEPKPLVVLPPNLKPAPGF